MALTPESLARHELVGLPVRVTAADNEDLVEIAGEVVAETTQMLGIEHETSAPASRTESGDDSDSDSDSDSAGDSDSDRVAHVPKAGTTFTFTLPDEAQNAPGASGESDPQAGADVTVEGRRLVARPARRTETTGEHRWR
jgi:ribonuclease P protein subunit POP4